MRIIALAAFSLSLLAGTAPTASAAATGVLERAMETKTLRLGYRSDAPPFSAKGQDGHASGYSITLCKAVADTVKAELNLPHITVEWVEVTAENRFDAIQAGEIDLLCGATTATLSRRKLVDFSLPTFLDGAGVMIAPGTSVQRLSDLSARKIGVRAGTTTEKAVRTSFAGADIVTFPDHRAGALALAEGSIGSYFADRTLLEVLKRSTPEFADMQIAEEYLTIEPYALALPHGDNDFRLAVDQTLSALYRSGRIGEIVKESFGGAKLGSLVQALFRIVPLPR
jgi:ABC-type amino acid transport substrate-binding protein